VTSLKANTGHLPAGPVLAEFHVAPHAGGTTFRLTAPATADDLTDLVLAYVLQHTAQHGRGPSKNQVRTAVRHAETARTDAIKTLVANKKITIHEDGNALRLMPVLASTGPDAPPGAAGR